jgi:hypothetical protein
MFEIVFYVSFYLVFDHEEDLKLKISTFNWKRISGFGGKIWKGFWKWEMDFQVVTLGLSHSNI